MTRPDLTDAATPQLDGADPKSPRERYCAIPTPALLLAGSSSPAYLRGVLPALPRSMPQATAVELHGFNHGAPDAAVPVIAARVRQFLVDHQP